MSLVERTRRAASWAAMLGLTFKLSFMVLAAGQGADIYTTGQCRAKGFHEANPILRPLEDHPYRMGAAKMALASSIGLIAHRLHQTGHPRLAVVVNLVGGSAGFAFAARNAHTCDL